MNNPKDILNFEFPRNFINHKLTKLREDDSWRVITWAETEFVSPKYNRSKIEGLKELLNSKEDVTSWKENMDELFITSLQEELREHVGETDLEIIVRINGNK